MWACRLRGTEKECACPYFEWSAFAVNLIVHTVLYRAFYGMNECVQMKLLRVLFLLHAKIFAFGFSHMRNAHPHTPKFPSVAIAATVARPINETLITNELQPSVPFCVGSKTNRDVCLCVIHIVYTCALLLQQFTTAHFIRMNVGYE